MENYRKSSHCTYDIKYHLVWITKYRKPVITGKIAIRTRELIRIVCEKNEVEILAGHVGSDYIHMLVSVPPHLSASKLVQYIKGATSRKLQMEYKCEQVVIIQGNGHQSGMAGAFCMERDVFMYPARAAFCA